jgi:peroxiredoxin
MQAIYQHARRARDHCAGMSVASGNGVTHRTPLLRSAQRPVTVLAAQQHTRSVAGAAQRTTVGRRRGGGLFRANAPRVAWKLHPPPRHGYAVSYTRKGIRMPQTASRDISIGWSAPAFTLPEPLTGKHVSLADYAGQPVLIAFISNVCPSVKLIDQALTRFAQDYAERGLRVLAVNANAPEVKAGESAEDTARTARELGYPFPYLRDETQSVADAFDAACTPDLYLLDAHHRLYYHGQFDDARPNSGVSPTGKDLRAAADLLLAGKDAPATQIQSIGCNIKWRGGDEHGVRAAAIAA